MRRHQPLPEGMQPRGGPERRGNHVLCRADRRQIGRERVFGQSRWRGRMGRHRREPEIEPNVSGAFWKLGEVGGQAQDLAIIAGPGNMFGGHRQPTAQAKPMPAFLGDHRLDLDGRVTAKPAEHHGNTGAHFLKRHPRDREIAPAIEPPGNPVPELANGLLRFPGNDLDHVSPPAPRPDRQGHVSHRPHRSAARSSPPPPPGQTPCRAQSA